MRIPYGFKSNLIITDGLTVCLTSPYSIAVREYESNGWAVLRYVRNDSLGWLQGLRYITPAHPQDVWVSGLLRRKLGRHVGLPGRSVLATGAKTHYCGRRCLHAPRIAGVCSSDAGDLQQSSGEMSLGLGYIPLNAGTTKPAGNYTRSKSPWLLEVVLCRNWQIRLSHGTMKIQNKCGFFWSIAFIFRHASDRVCGVFY